MVDFHNYVFLSIPFWKQEIKYSVVLRRKLTMKIGYVKMVETTRKNTAKSNWICVLHSP